MECPACLQYNLHTEANVQVAGTLYCPQHGVEAMVREQGPQRGPRRTPVFSPPAPPVSPPEP